MTKDQLEALQYYITAVVLFMTRDVRGTSGSLDAAAMNLEHAFGFELKDTKPKPAPFPDIL